ncbi:MAG: helix-turn-helix domain-containing protein [Clostridiales bacterium]|jgi:transcriptional regulator with XRE-family HTH domain|nr:helix-turn-helix domain-containing protein [Clostridiales bacterium]
MNKIIFSTRLRALRKATGLTQADLGRVLGGTQSFIKHLEMGDSFPNIDNFLAIAEYFHVTTDYLFGRTDDPHHTDINPAIRTA